jgi:FMN reductase
MSRQIVVVTAGLGVPSATRLLADRLAAAITRTLEQRGEKVHVDVVELRPLAHALADNLLTGFPSGELADAVETVRRADGLVAVTPVFSASYSGLFKSFFDVLDPETLAGTPVLVAATAGTARHSLVLDHALRPLFSYLRAVVVPTGVFAASEDFGSTDGGALSQRIDRAAGELADLVSARPSRLERELVDELADHEPFEELLRRA